MFRPTLEGLFGTTHRVTGSIDGLPYHVAALVVIVGAALAAQWLARRLGAAPLGAVAAGVVVGANATLGVTTIWVSAATSSLALLFALLAAAVALTWASWPARVAAVGLMLLAVGAREIVVLTPPLVVLALVVVEGRETLRRQLVRTAPLWLVVAVFVVTRQLLADPAEAGSPYVIDPIGGHVLTNGVDLLQWLSRFGNGRRETVLVAWDVLFWLVVAAAVWFAVRRGSRLALAGALWLLVSLIPPALLPNKPMEAYYLDFALVGLALVVAGVVDLLDRRVAMVGLSVLVASQVVAMALVRQDFPYRPIVDRNEALEHRFAHRRLVRDGVLTVRSACEYDGEWTRDGDMFRVLLDERRLEVHYVVVDDGDPRACSRKR